MSWPSTDMDERSSHCGSDLQTRVGKRQGWTSSLSQPARGTHPAFLRNGSMSYAWLCPVSLHLHMRIVSYCMTNHRTAMTTPFSSRNAEWTSQAYRPASILSEPRTTSVREPVPWPYSLQESLHIVKNKWTCYSKVWKIPDVWLENLFCGDLKSLIVINERQNTII